MKLRQCLLSLAVLACSAGPLAASGPVTETWRNPWGAPVAAAANPADRSVWVAIGSSVVHLSADGTVLLRTDDFWGPAGVAVNAADGSCWVADGARNEVVHLSAAGEELWRGGGFVSPVFVSVSPDDGSVWIGQAGQTLANPEVTGEPEVIHLAADGTVLSRTNAYSPSALAVSPADGACWLVEYDTSRLVRLSPTGEETVAVSGLTSTGQIGVGAADGSVWVGDYLRQQVVHISASGEELWRGGNLPGPSHVTVSPADGSVWVMVLSPLTGQLPPLPTEVVHLSADGEELWRAYGFAESWAKAGVLAANPADGSLWVADVANSALVHVAADGGWLLRLQDFDDAVAVAANGADQTVWVADQGRNRIVQLNQDGQEVRVLNGYWPVSLAVSPSDGTIWEVDLLAGLVHFGGDGTELWRKAFINLSSTVAINPKDGSAWVSTDDAVLHLSATGDELWRGTALAPQAIDPDDGSYWAGVTIPGHDGGDPGQGWVVHVAADGHEIWRSADGMFVCPYALALDPRDRSLRVVDYSNDMVTSLSLEGEELWSTDVGLVPRSVAVDPADGACWVAAYGSSTVALLSADGTILWTGHRFSAPTSVSVDAADGACWVAGGSQVVRLDSSRFTDVPADSWAADAIYGCAEAGLVTGYWDGRYQPSLPVTRDQVAVYLARALAGSDAAVPAGPSQSAFTDVATDDWAYRHIAYCAQSGVVEGYPGGAYAPDQVVNRAQMAVFVSRAIADPVGEAGLADYRGPSSATFSDVSQDHWAYRYIEYAAAHGIVQGIAGHYVPDAAVTRDQMAVFVARAFLQ